jgi:hypothetical protein
MIERREEGTMDPSTTRRLLVTTAVVSALAILLAAPANAYLMNEGGSATTSAPLVGNPGDGALAAQAATRTGEPLVAQSGGSDGIGTEAIVGVGASLALVVAIGALFFTVRHRRVALP